MYINIRENSLQLWQPCALTRSQADWVGGPALVHYIKNGSCSELCCVVGWLIFSFVLVFGVFWGLDGWTILFKMKS